MPQPLPKFTRMIHPELLYGDHTVPPLRQSPQVQPWTPGQDWQKPPASPMSGVNPDQAPGKAVMAPAPKQGFENMITQPAVNVQNQMLFGGGVDEKTLAEKLPDPLKPYAGAFVNAGVTNGVSPLALAAISRLETGHGTSNVFKKYQNAMGISSDKGAMDWSQNGGVEGSIAAMAKKLATDKAYEEARKQNTIEALGKIYSPVGASNDPNGTNKDWVPGVQRIMKMMQG